MDQLSDNQPLESRLKSLEIKSRAWLENSAVCTKILDLDFNLKYMSNAGISGLKIQDVSPYYGKPYPFDFFPEDSKILMNENLIKVRENLEPITFESAGFDLEGAELWFLSNLIPVSDQKGELDYIMVVSTDITQRRLGENKIREKKEEIEAQNKKYELLTAQLQKSNAALIIAKEKAEESEALSSAFLANMSHEIRTPLNSILGFTNLLKINENIHQEEKEKYFEYIESGGNRLLRLISDIVDISKIDAGQLSIHKESENLNQFLDSLFSQLSIQVKKHNVSFHLNKSLADAESTFLFDKTRVAQVISNLVENAVKFTTEGVVHIGYELKRNTITFHVRDNGIGIDPSEHRNIFERFRQADKLEAQIDSGTGLGLAITKELTRLMNGEIWVESEKGDGATFYFTLPFDTLEHRRSNPISTIDEPIITKLEKEITVLIAEDELINFIYLEALVKELNFKVIRANNGEEAVEIVKNNPHIDLVLMDIRMPLMDGIEATKMIRKLNKSIPIVAQSAYVLEEDKEEAFEAGMDDYLEKPIVKENFNRIMSRFIKVVA